MAAPHNPGALSRLEPAEEVPDVGGQQIRHLQPGEMPADRRRNAITLTEEGRRHLKRLDVLLADAEAEFLAPLSPADRAELSRTLKVIVAHHSEP